MRREEGGRVGDLLTREVDADRVAAGWDRVRARRARPRAIRRAMVVAPLAVALVAIVLVMRAWLAPSPSPTAATAPAAAPAAVTVAPIALAGGASLPVEWHADSAARAVALDDGSHLELAPSTQVRTAKSAPERVELAVDRGSATFDVKPGGPRMWVVDAGPVVVRVLGTRFTVARTGDEVVVSVERGKVQVESRGIVRVLTAGEKFETASPTKPTASASLSAPVSASVPAEVAAAPKPIAAAPAVDAMDRADSERRGGQPRAAVATLRALVDGGDRRAPLAAFTIAKIHAEDLGDALSGAKWFDRAIALGLPGGLDEEAHARAVEGYSRAGARAEASRARGRYEARFPNGRHLARVKEWAAARDE